VPLNVASFNPDLLEDIGLDNILDGLADGPNYRNDAMHDNQVRSILFQIPNPGFDPTALDGPASIEQFSSVLDLIAIDVERGRDMGMPSYNDLRETYGLPRMISFTEITGESTEDLPAGMGIDDPSVINWKDLEGNELQPEDAPGELHVRGSVPLDIPTESIQMTTVAARLKAIYGTVDAIEAFAGMVSEKHLANSAFGELQDAIWTTQFQALRDGDRFYYENKNNGLFDKAKDGTYSMAGIPVLHSLHDIIVANTALESGDIPLNVFLPSSGAGSAAPLTAAVPEPSTLALTALGLLGIGWRRRKRA
jgi:hypothetical protein